MTTPSQDEIDVFVNAAFNDDFETLSQLFNSHGSAIINAPNTKGVTALTASTNKGKRVECFDFLIENNADVNRAYKGFTPLLEATVYKRLYHMERLLEKGADALITDGDNWSVLHYAGRDGFTDAIQPLVDYGADINAQNNRLWTPLLLAAFNGNIKGVDLLLRLGANPLIMNDKNETPAMLVLKTNYADLAPRLHEAERHFVAANAQDFHNGITQAVHVKKLNLYTPHKKQSF